VTAPVLSVVVCTRDRAGLLGDCLASVRQQVAEGPVEVLVVDNGSTDDTAAVVEAAPGVRYVAEPLTGLSRARNTGLEAARAPLVAYVDDDARAEPGWAQALVDSARRWPPAAAFAGPVTLAWSGPRPRWLVPELERWFSAVDHGDRPRLLSPSEWPVGANLALRRDAVLAAGGFSVDLGRIGGSLGSEEEVELVRRLRAAGGEVAWAPLAAVRHLVPPERATRRWLLRRSWAQGRSDAVAARLRDDVPPSRARQLAGVLGRGWPGAARRVAGANPRGGELMREMVSRSRRLARATA